MLLHHGRHLREPPIPRLAQHDIKEKLHLAIDGEPCSFAEAEGGVAWRAAMQ